MNDLCTLIIFSINSSYITWYYSDDYWLYEFEERFFNTADRNNIMYTMIWISVLFTHTMSC